jgi:hypothetical protein
MMVLGRAFAVLVVAGSVLAPVVAAAQSPFDMTPERGEAPSAPPAASPPAAAPAAPPAGSGFRPFDVGDSPAASPPPATAVPPAAGVGVVPNDLTRDRPVSEDAPVDPAAARLDPGRIDRYLLSEPQLRFEGESGQRSWGFSLTGEQAERAATLAIAFNSSIFVSPEDSLLRITINDKRIVDQPLAARENPTKLDTPIPPGTLRPGVNVITFLVEQRHRTDCTIQSTYDLWTEFESDGTGLVFEGDDPTTLASLDDLPAVGLDATGRTRLQLIAPGGERV